MLGHIVSKTATELSFIKRSLSIKDGTTENNWTIELGFGDGIDIPIDVLVGLLRRDQFNQQQQRNDTFNRPSVVSAQCVIGTERFPMQE